MSYDELAKQLRNMGAYNRSEDVVLDVAADAIVTLQARVAELTDERDELVQLGALDGRKLTEEVAALRHDIARHVQIAAEQANDMSRLLDCVKYVRGIAERGEGRKMRDDETVSDFVLGYVKRIEAELAAARAALRELIGMIEIASVMPDAIHKHLRVEWDDPALQRARAALAGQRREGEG